MKKQKKTLVIRPEFKGFLRPLTKVELAALEQSLLDHGCRDPLIVWPTPEGNVLVDGHTRHDICTRHGIPFTVAEQDFADDDAVYLWMRKHAEGRRNMTRSERKYYLGLRYNREKGERGGDGSNQHKKKLIPQAEGLAETAVRIATEEKTSRATVERAGEFANMVDELEERIGNQIKWAILSEQMGFSKRLYEALTDEHLRKGEALKALEGAVAEKKDQDKPVSTSAVLKKLGKLPEQPAGEQQEMPPDIVQDVKDTFIGIYANAIKETDLARLAQIKREAELFALRLQALINNKSKEVK